jgi:archaeal type IV pilus assembly protein PilA
MQQTDRNGMAVSPVVGVMLMLVVTIIIAAVVSAFAGGLGQGSAKAPQVSMSAEAHNGSYILLDFKGGDTISGSAITIKTFIPMGDHKDMSHTVDRSTIVYLPTNDVGITSHTIQPGDKLKINWADAFATAVMSGKSYPQTPAVGEPVDIEIYDSASGKQIANTRATVLP